jgi:hypothetical protein
MARSWALNDKLRLKIEKSLGKSFDVLYLPYLLIDDTKSWKYFREWFSSFRKGKSLLEKGVPWMPYLAIQRLKDFLKPQMLVFEYGSGGSTVFFAQRVKRVFSVEHDPRWHALVSEALRMRNLTNCEYLLREPRRIGPPPKGEPSIYGANARPQDHPEMNFDSYVRAIECHPDEPFDLVVVDGQARTACIEHALKKMRRGGYLLLDNSNNPDIADSVQAMPPYPRTDFHGVAPGWPPARWRTTVWEIDR